MSRLRLAQRTLTLSGGTTGAEDWSSTERLLGGLCRVFRISTNDDGVTAAAPAIEVDDQNGNSIDLDTDLYATDGEVAATGFRGILVEGLYAAMDDFAEDDEFILTIQFESD